MTRQVLLATRNTKKLAELRRILAEAIESGTGEGLDVDVIGLDSVAAYDEAPETGATFAENALLKASEAVRHSGLLAVADDSGITVDALNGMPGVLSARWAGTAKDDDKNLELVLEQLADVPEDRLGAAFVCAAAFVTPTGERHVSEGVMPGRLIRQRRGTNGFGYDPIFVPEGFELTSAELEPMDKDAISHRGQALRSLLPHLLNALGAR